MKILEIEELKPIFVETWDKASFYEKIRKTFRNNYLVVKQLQNGVRPQVQRIVELSFTQFYD